ncbi:MAG: hypothetical protein ACR2QF_11880 [Geminicoccaceae bacterium]
MEAQTETAEASTTETSTPADAAPPPAEGEATTEALLTGEDSGTGDDAGKDVSADGDKPAAAENAENAENGEDKPAAKDAASEDDTPAADADAKPEDETKDEAETSESEGDNLEGLPEDFDWRELSTDEKNRNRLRQFSSMDDLATFVREADSWRRRAVIPPNAKSTPEEIARFQKAIGVPESPAGYEIQLEKDAPEDEVARVDRLKEAAFGVHVTPAQLGAMIEWHQAETQAVEARENDRLVHQLNQAKTDLSREWGPDYQKNLGAANQILNRAFEGYAEDWGDLELKDGTKVRDHPLTARGLAKIGRLMGEAGVPGEVAPADWLPNESELGKMMEEPGYQDGTDKALIVRVKEGYKRLYPS